MTTLWITIFAVGLASAAIKAAGPVLVGGRELSGRAVAVIHADRPDGAVEARAVR